MSRTESGHSGHRTVLLSRQGLPGHPAYAASKGGICALVRQLAVEYGPAVRVNAVLPGPILTAAWSDIDEAERSNAGQATALQRMGSPMVAAVAVSRRPIRRDASACRPLISSIKARSTAALS